MEIELKTEKQYQEKREKKGNFSESANNASSLKLILLALSGRSMKVTCYLGNVMKGS